MQLFIFFLVCHSFSPHKKTCTLFVRTIEKQPISRKSGTFRICKDEKHTGSQAYVFSAVPPYFRLSFFPSLKTALHSPVHVGSRQGILRYRNKPFQPAAREWFSGGACRVPCSLPPALSVSTCGSGTLSAAPLCRQLYSLLVSFTAFAQYANKLSVCQVLCRPRKVSATAEHLKPSTWLKVRQNWWKGRSSAPQYVPAD
jgi:hypothetical protein